jgi:transcription elongation GreA/GreB family factor
MKPQSLLELVNSKDFTSVEEQWRALVKDEKATPKSIAKFTPILAGLKEANRAKQAEELAWMALEAMQDRHEAPQVLKLVSKFLLTLGNDSELRAIACDLYRTVHGDRPGFDALLEEAGLAAGRPVRRALRTMEVALAVKEGDFLVSRDEHHAARVESIDPDSWRITIEGDEGTDKLRAVHLADQFAPAPPTNFFVMRQFQPDELQSRIENEPASVIVDLCRQHDNRIDSEQIEWLLVPEFLQEKTWKKWWTAARAALRKNANVSLEGRGPWIVSYTESPATPEEQFEERLRKAYDPETRYAEVHRYAKECRALEAEPAEELVLSCQESLAGDARDLASREPLASGLCWIRALELGEMLDQTDATVRGEAIGWVRSLENKEAFVHFASDKDDVLDIYCALIIEAYPDEWQSTLLELLPQLSLSTCVTVSGKLAEAGIGPEQFRPIVEQVLLDPIPHFEALLWLWDNPDAPIDPADAPPLTILAKLLDAVEDARRDERVSKDIAKRVAARARSVLAARQHERFRACLESMDRPMANTFRNQLKRSQALGRAVRDDLLRHLETTFPPIISTPRIAPWAREDILFTTQVGYSRRQAEADELINVKMKENAKAIGEAAARGDLSENSEYKFALEERDLLRARLAQMNSELDIAKVLDPNAVPVDHVGVGTRVKLKRASDGQVLDMCFLGPWDTSKERSIYNYKAPLAQKVLGSRMGETVELDFADFQGQYEVIELSNELVD